MEVFPGVRTVVFLRGGGWRIFYGLGTQVFFRVWKMVFVLGTWDGGCFMKRRMEVF